MNLKQAKQTAAQYNVRKLLSGSYKIDKSNASASNYYTAILYLAPYNKSGRNVCPWASAECIATCLDTAGRGQMTVVQQARKNRTDLFFADRAAFLTLLDHEITLAERRATKKGLRLAVRLNGTSDLVWESYTLKWSDNSVRNIMARHQSVQWYDYTKSVNRALKYSAGLMPHNYHLTLSRTESNWLDCLAPLDSGVNVAAVFADVLPETYAGYRVIDGDTTDERFLDPSGVIVGLTAKGKARKHDGGFVIASHIN